MRCVLSSVFLLNPPPPSLPPPVPYRLPHSTDSSQPDPCSLPSVVARAVAALRCLPCAVGSFARTVDARRDAVVPTVALVDELMVALSTSQASSDVPVVRGVANGKMNEDQERGSATKLGRKRGRKRGNSGQPADGGVESERVIMNQEFGAGDHQRGSGNDEMVVARAYALEAGVGLCCLISVDESPGTGRQETLKRLMSWHDR